MKAIEFRTKLVNNIIKIPDNIELKLSSNQNKNIRVILLLEEIEDDLTFKELAQNHFLDGYADSDSIYDNY